MLSPSSIPTWNSHLCADPSQRLEFIKRQLGEHGAVRLIVTEATDACRKHMAGPLAHALTIERNGSGYKIQDITVNSDGQFTVGEHLITRRGRFVEVPGHGNVTKLSDLKALLRQAPPIPSHPASRYRDHSQASLIDRLVVNERKTNDTKQVQAGQGKVVHKSEFDVVMKRAVYHLGNEVESRVKAGTFLHPFNDVVRELLPLAKARAARVQLAETLRQSGLADFTFSGDDMM